MLSDSWDKWVQAHSPQLKELAEVTENHPALHASRVVGILCEYIRNGNPLAIQLALSLLNEDPRMPFGKGLKSQIARAFKAIAGTLNDVQRAQLARYRDKLCSLEHPPREAAEFDRVVRSFAGPGQTGNSP